MWYRTVKYTLMYAITKHTYTGVSYGTVRHGPGERVDPPSPFFYQGSQILHALFRFLTIPFPLLG